MYRLIVLCFILFSCGKEAAVTEQVRDCNNNVSVFKDTWTQINTGTIYDLRYCEPNTTCELSLDGGCGNNPEDIEIVYNEAGGFSLEYCQSNEELSGNWRICEGRLELYNLSNGADIEVFR